MFFFIVLMYFNIYLKIKNILKIILHYNLKHNIDTISNLRIDLENNLVNKLIPGSLDELFLLKQYYLFLFFFCFFILTKSSQLNY